jgi:hypothetical protein
VPGEYLIGQKFGDSSVVVLRCHLQSILPGTLSLECTWENGHNQQVNKQVHGNQQFGSLLKDGKSKLLPPLSNPLDIQVRFFIVLAFTVAFTRNTWITSSFPLGRMKQI